MKRIYEEHKFFTASVLERIVMNYITTNRSIRDLAKYYGVPKSTLHSWIKQSYDFLPFDLTSRLQSTAAMHRRSNVLRMLGLEEYRKVDLDGPLD